MKTKVPSLPEWSDGLTVETVGAGLLLKPRPKPREGWSKAFGRKSSGGHDELALTRQIANRFDVEEWQW